MILNHRGHTLLLKLRVAVMMDGINYSKFSKFNIINFCIPWVMIKDNID